MTVLEGVEIGTADAAGERSDQHLTGSRRRVGNLVDDELSASHHRGAHGGTVVPVTKYLGVDDPDALDAAEATLAAGEPIVLPTDTVYGLAALPSATGAIDRVYELKDRPPSVPIAMLVGSLAEADGLWEASTLALGLAHAFWPGPLTIVGKRRGAGGTVGVRCPDHDFIRALAGRTGPLAVTSANRHGERTPATAREAAGGLLGAVALVVDGGRCEGEPSTVVDVTRSELAIIRVGPITEEQIRAAALR